MSELAIGIMSGTSADGIDLALVEADLANTRARVRLVEHRAVRFDDALRGRILAAASGAATSAWDLARLHATLGETYADAAAALAAGRRPTVIGLHGQTVAHFPAEDVTLQLGDAARVAVRTGIPTVADFRSADIAAGGEGAPLTPFADHVLFADLTPRIVLNLGGIANVTLLPDALAESVVGFDTGPGNMVSDALARPVGARYDEDGAAAGRGRVRDRALRTALAHPFFSRPAPKSTGREEFGEAFVAALRRDVEAEGGSYDDVFATASELSARTISDAITGATPAGVAWREVLVAGGGAQNVSLMERLRRALAPIPLRRTDAVGVPASAREAVAFAILALYRMRGLPNTLPRVTGASRAVSAGAVHRP